MCYVYFMFWGLGVCKCIHIHVYTYISTRAQVLIVQGLGFRDFRDVCGLSDDKILRTAFMTRRAPAKQYAPAVHLSTCSSSIFQITPDSLGFRV